MKQAELVEAMLQKYPRTRSSDTDLIIGILQSKGACLTEQQRNIIRSVNFESIRRTRQLLQHDGKYLPSADILASRKHKASMVRDAAGAHNDDMTIQLIKAPLPDWLEGVAGIA